MSQNWEDSDKNENNVKKKLVSRAIICPRCGQPGYKYMERRGFRLYYYVVHIENRRKRRKCYLGPVEGYVRPVPMPEMLVHMLTPEQRRRLLELLQQQLQ
ncbi:MAG: hypothetical protein QXT13_08080 [Pyrobaculum sp.]